ncbi:tubby C-terminal-like domain-containing protein [Entophlyctis helioformis]|nr:tubby C-terminal-like domain-containing protein [Entophlyctis helioformis]
MGQAQSSPSQLVSPPVPVILNDPRFALQQPVTLRLKGGWFREESFSINDLNGIPYFKVAHKFFSLKDKKTLFDVNGTAVYNLKKAMFSMPQRYTIFAGSDSAAEVAEIVAKFRFAAIDLKSTFTNKTDGKQTTFYLNMPAMSFTGNVFMGKPNAGGIPVAYIDRPPFSARNFFGTSEYHVTIMPGADIALVLLLCIALEEEREDRKE